MEEINFGLTDVQILKDEIKLAWKKCEESNYTQETVSRAASLIKALHGKVNTEDEKAACIRLLKELKKRRDAAEEGRKAVQIVEAVYRSAKTGEKIRINELT